MSCTVTSACSTSCAMSRKGLAVHNGAWIRLFSNLLAAWTDSRGNTEVKLLFKTCNWIIDHGTKESISFIRCGSVFRWTCTLNFSTMPHFNGINSVCDSILAYLNQLVTPAPPNYNTTNKVWDSECAIHNIQQPHSITIQAYWLYFQLKIGVSEL